MSRTTQEIIDAVKAKKDETMRDTLRDLEDRAMAEVAARPIAGDLIESFQKTVATERILNREESPLLTITGETPAPRLRAIVFRPSVGPAHEATFVATDQQVSELAGLINSFCVIPTALKIDIEDR